MSSIRVLSTGRALPDKIVDNAMLSKIVDTNDEWIVSRTGIKTRHIAEEKNTSDLAAEAAFKAIEKAHILKDQIDCIIVATMTPDQVTPSVACQLIKKLNLRQSCMAFDLNAACSGFVVALQTAVALIQTEEVKCALVVGADVMSKIVDWQDRGSCILFGDGAGAMIIEKGQSEITCVSFAQSDQHDVLTCEGAPLTRQFTKESYRPLLAMKGNEVYRFAVNALQDAVEKVLIKANKRLDEVDLLIPHQANARIIQSVIKKLNIDPTKVFTNLEHTGNTSAASVILALDEAIEEGRLKKGQTVLLSGFGAGLTWSAALFEY